MYNRYSGTESYCSQLLLSLYGTWSCVCECLSSSPTCSKKKKLKRNWAEGFWAYVPSYCSSTQNDFFFLFFFLIFPSWERKASIDDKFNKFYPILCFCTGFEYVKRAWGSEKIWSFLYDSVTFFISMVSFDLCLHHRWSLSNCYFNLWGHLTFYEIIVLLLLLVLLLEDMLQIGGDYFSCLSHIPSFGCMLCSSG